MSEYKQITPTKRLYNTRFFTFDNTEELNDYLTEHPECRVVNWRLKDRHFGCLVVQVARSGGWDETPATEEAASDE